MTKSVKRRACSAVGVLCACALLVGGPVSLNRPLQARASSIEDLQAQKEALAQKEKELQAQKDSLSGSLSDQKQRKEYIEQQIALKEQEIELNRQLTDTVEQAIAEKDAELSRKEQAIAAKEREINDRFTRLQDRLRTISKTGNLSSLQMLLSTDDYVDYLLKSKIMKQIATSDQELIDSLESELAVIGKERSSLLQAKESLESERTELLKIHEDAARAKEELDALCYEVQVVTNGLQDDLDYYNSLLQKVKEDEAALEEEIERIIRESTGGGTVMTGKMQWPSQSCSIITCYYGGRYLDGSYNFHKGIDIACYGSAYGKDIRAAADGTVLYANKYDSWGGGYGYYLMVDHGYDANGQRIVTLYAHCSYIIASEGETVRQGQQIAEIGNTGWSYGAHLHFEVRVDGSPVDPLTNGWVVQP